MQNLKTMFSTFPKNSKSLTTVIINLCLRAQWPLGTATDAESNTSWCAAPASKWSRGGKWQFFFLFDWQRSFNKIQSVNFEDQENILDPFLSLQSC